MGARPPTMSQASGTLYHLATALKGLKLGKRVQPVSHAICEDVVKRLGPTLASHRHCDIVDIYPGAGLLSTKFHNALQPRRHVLLEPQMKVFGSFLNPLLKPPDTPYRHLSLDPYDLATYEKLFDEDHLPDQSPKSTGANGLNNSLLVLANLTGGAPEGYSRGFLFMRLLESYLTKTLLNRYGLVRMIGVLRTPEGDVVLPKHIRGRHRTSLLAECVGKEVAELASTSDHYDHALVRGVALYNKSREATESRQKANDAYCPEDRVPGPLPLAADLSKPGERSPPRAKRDWYDAFEELHTRYRRGRVRKPPKVRSTRDDPKYAEYYAHATQLSRYRLETRNEADALELVEKEESIRTDENDIIRMLKDSSTTIRQVHKALEALEQKRNEMLTRVKRLRVAQIRYKLLAEEIEGYNNDKSADGRPMLLWDRRPYEPMKISPDEVYPEGSQITIVDIQPDPDTEMLRKRRELEEAGSLRKYDEVFHAFSNLLGIFSLKGQTPVGDIIGRLFPGRPMASILEAIPSLKPYAIYKAFEPVSARERARNVFRRPRVAQSSEEAKKELLSYSDNCLESTMLRHLPAKVAWDITLEWLSWPERAPGSDITRFIGGGMFDLVPGTHDD